MFTFKVDKNNIKMIESETVTSGSVNVYDCQFIFSEEWEGLSKTVAFKAGDVAVASILNDDNICKIPWEVLKTDGADLFVGVKGAAGTETEEIDDDIILPTVWAYIGIIRKGATDGTDPLPPSPSVYEQILIEIKKLEDGKQDKITAGEGIEISADNVISCTVTPYDDTAIRNEITTQGEAISTQGEAISANSRAITDNSEAISRLNNDINTKQDKITGTKGQIVGFDDNGNPVAQDYTAGTTYTAGEGIEISADNVISSTVKPYDDTAIRNEITTQGEAISTQGEAISANSRAITDNSEAISRLNNDINTKQDKITGTKGQIVGFDDNGNPVAQEGGEGAPGKDGTTFTPMVSESGVISWTNDGGKENPEPVNIKGAPGTPGTPGTPGNDGVTFTPTVSAEGVISWSNDGGKENPDPVSIKGTPGTPGTPGNDGVTFTPTVSAEGVISWTNDGGRENPSDVNIKGQKGDPGNNGVTPSIGTNGNWFIGETDTGVEAQGPQGDPGPAGAYTAGAGIEITNDTIGLKNTASTKYNSGKANITGIGGFDFTLTSQMSSIISLTEYLKTSPSGEGSMVFKTRYGYAQIKISARNSATLSTAKALQIIMSDSVNMMGAAGLARITIGEGYVPSENIYVALVYADREYLNVYPTQTISIAKSDTLIIDLYVH